ncbi:hypothetical protein RFI_35279, partial [Reticulomyxa filosa]
VKNLSVELNEWDENADDGSKNGKRYFSCKTGRGSKDIGKALKVPSDQKYLNLDGTGLFYNNLLNKQNKMTNDKQMT